MSKPTLQTIAQELALFQLNTLKKQGESDELIRILRAESVDHEKRIKELEDARETRNMLEATESASKAEASLIPKPSLFERLFKRK